ncbi:dihydroxyacetone kinase subunit L [Candidatus Symbiopectobacterium sp. 'North America']|uniref:dihydroxyacetone kinase subunit DhaL n=1 Tax=Candidatus Symbiopectobacterium sp. 'North America' TaxID=2794574 RepID=UPI0018CAB2EA|nr:dihydroxyacetone kinase subunit DhaL [Candidatus Symbiopectobacterium sp. 'North America']MBG6243866.1 dihydroxyacetone kinase subunit L [Candidatus Symbiopectobacterium sp. 'North America']
MVKTKSKMISWLDAAADVFEQQQEFLTDLDREIGDADHGLNMNRGFRKVKEKLPTLADKDIGTIMKNTGMVLLSTIGGASGPLYGTFFIKAAETVMAKEELTVTDLYHMYQEGTERIIARGMAHPGDKTMVDTLSTIVASLKARQEDPLSSALAETLKAAEQGMKSTIPLSAAKGHASYLGERAIGHQDPGATSSYLLFKTLCDVVDM